MSTGERQKRWRQEHPEAYQRNQRRQCERRKADRLELRRLRVESQELRERIDILEGLLRTRQLGAMFGPIRRRARA